MTLFIYDKTFEGLLSCVFFAYEQKIFPDNILPENASQPLFVDFEYTIVSETDKAQRVWAAMEKKISKIAQNMVLYTWMSELPEVEMLLFRYIRKNIDHPQGIEMNFGDDDVLRIKQLAQKVNHEVHRYNQFIRFQQTADGLYFAPISPQFNILTLLQHHFKSRYNDQQWIIYDTRRNTGLYYDKDKVEEITFSKADVAALKLGTLSDDKLSDEEKYFEELWKSYFESITIKQRINLKLQRQNMPKKFWKYLTEMQ